MQAPGLMGAAVGRADPLEDIMSEPGLVDITGRLRSPAATPGHWTGCAPPNKGLRYPQIADGRGDHPRDPSGGVNADRIRALIAILWRAGLRISEALALTETDLDPKTGSVLTCEGAATIGLELVRETIRSSTSCSWPSAAAHRPAAWVTSFARTPSTRR
jgi:hypothetical protein